MNTVCKIHSQDTNTALEEMSEAQVVQAGPGSLTARDDRQLTTIFTQTEAVGPTVPQLNDARHIIRHGGARPVM